MLLHRQAYSRLTAWYNNQRRKPLVLRGARQVGKSTLIEIFAKNEGLRLVTINCEKQRQLDPIFESLDLSRILRELEAVADQGPIGPEMLLFLDEIQATPHALQALRYFYEERPDIAVIGAGSLLEFTLSKHQFSMPVGRIQYLHLGPMGFREFISSLEPDLLVHLDGIGFDSPLTQTAHDRFCSLLRIYLYVGGMPEAVATYQETSSLSEVSEVQREIVDTYIDDFAKYAREQDLILLQRVFSSVPRLLGQKIKYVNMAPNERAAKVRAIIDLLTKAQVLIPIFHSHCSGVPLGANIDDSVFKLSFLDVGLANHICGLDWQALSTPDETRLVNSASIAEQFVAQQLAWQRKGKPELTYWQREGRRSNAEVDFVCSFGPKIYPLEVKAGTSGSLKSLHQFVLRKKAEQAIRLDLNQPSSQMVNQLAKTDRGSEEISFELLSLPLYAIENLPSLLTNV